MLSICGAKRSATAIIIDLDIRLPGARVYMKLPRCEHHE
jgi:hypothetical protein